jgi:agmatine deiminase
MATLAGAEIITYPTAIGLIALKAEENITGDWEGMWRAAQVGHAAVNNVFVAAVNRVGQEEDLSFWGGSFVAGPDGRVMALGGAAEGLVIADCDRGRVPALQKAWRFLELRRPGVYGALTR